MSVTVELKNVMSFISESSLSGSVPELYAAHDRLVGGTGRGSEFTGWVSLPESYDREELSAVKEAARKIRGDSAALVVIGIGGSYLGARAVLEFLKSPRYNLTKKDTPDIFFAGNGVSADDLEEIIELIGDREFSVNVISKSGTTMEPAVAFRVFRDILEKRYGKKGAAGRIYATTDRERGALKEIAAAEGYRTFAIDDSIGGRYSVLTAVGLLPLATAGVNVEELLFGAGAASSALRRKSMGNPALRYAAARNLLYRKGKRVELLCSFEPSFRMMGEWWKQLFAESEGKEGKGLFTAYAEFTADLHSIGQYIQQGEPILFETVVSVDRPRRRRIIPCDRENADGLNYIAGKSLDEISKMARRGTVIAHVDGKVPNILIEIPETNEFHTGYLIYFFEFACAVSAYMLEVNPFDQPGVEEYKKNMFALIGKPGYEKLKDSLEKRI